MMGPLHRRSTTTTVPAGIKRPVILDRYFRLIKMASQLYTRSSMLLLVGLLLTWAVQAQDVVATGKVKTWKPISGGAWTSPLNWSDSTLPVNGDDIVINTNQSAPITAVPTLTVNSITVTGTCSLEGPATATTLTVNGNFSVAAGITMSLNNKVTLLFGAASTASIQGILSSTNDITCNNDMAIGPDGYISGMGRFFVNAGATLRIGSVNGIVTGNAASGNIQTTGARNYNPGANFVYNGVSAQNTGDGFPTALTGSLTINNSAGVTLVAAARTITTGSLNLTQGAFIINSGGVNRLSLGSSTTAATSTIKVTTGTITGVLQGTNLYNVEYVGNSKSTDGELSGAGFRDMTLNLNGGQILTLDANRTVPGTLTLTRGLIATNNFSLNVSSATSGSVSGGSSASYIIGKLQRSVAAGSSYTFPVGTAKGFAPVTLSFAAGTAAGALTVSTTDEDHPSLATASSINPAKSVNRYWNFSVNSGLTTPSYSANFSWMAADQDLEFDYLNAQVGNYNGTSWSYPTVGTRNPNDIQITGQTSFGDFQVGKGCTLTTISSQPVGGIVCQGATVPLSVTATGANLTYQWRKDGVNIPNATSSTYAAPVSGLYTVVVSGDCGTATSTAATVVVKASTVISVQPVGASICPGSSHTLSVTASGEGVLAYQWTLNGITINGATSSSYKTSAAGNYRVSVTGECGTVTSSVATVTVLKSTVILSQPQGGAICDGSNLSLRVSADGEGTLSYQWYKQNQLLTGDTSFAYTATTGGSYTVVVSGFCGPVTSNPAVVSINALTTITRQPVDTSITYGDNANFAVQATGTGTLSYQWQVSNGSGWTNLTDQGIYLNTAVPTLDLLAPTVANSGNLFKCVVGGLCGEAVSNEVMLNVNKALLTVTAEDKERIYGDSNPEMKVSFAGFRNGESLSNSGVSGKASFTVPTSLSTPAGTYDIIPGFGSLAAANYAFGFVNGKLKINPAALTLSAIDTNRIYGDANPEFEVTYNGFKNGEDRKSSDVKGMPDFQTLADNLSDVGNYDVTPGKGSLQSNNYSFQYAKGKLAILPATLSVTADSLEKYYGDLNPNFSVTYNGFKNGQQLSQSGVEGRVDFSTDADSLSDIGYYDIRVAKGSLNAKNYVFAFTKGALRILPASVEVTADDQSKTYGDPNPELTYTFSGFKHGQSVASGAATGIPAISTLADDTTQVGEYDITVAPGNLMAKNYVFKYKKGKLSIGKAMLSVAIDNKERIYGDPNPDFTAVYNGFRNGQNMSTSGIQGNPLLAALADTLAEVGEYAITGAPGTLISRNYAFQFVAGKLSILPATLTLTADSLEKYYGDPNPEFTTTFSGFKNGQSFLNSGLSGNPAFSTEADTLTDVGTYDIQIAKGSLGAKNYIFNFKKGFLKILPVTVTVTADDKQREYGDVNPEFTATYAGFKHGQSAATGAVAGIPVFSTIADSLTEVGDYDIQVAPGTLISRNYAFKMAKGKLKITQASIAVTADDYEREYGDENPTLTVQYAGFKNGQDLTSSGLSGTPAINVDATNSSDVGEYDIAVSKGSLASARYAFRFIPGKLRIGKATVTIAALDTSRIYGDANPDFAVQYSGFRNGQQKQTSGVEGEPLVNSTANEWSDVGEYDIAVDTGSLKAKNYKFKLVKGMLQIHPAMLNVVAEEKERMYGEENPALTYTINGYKNNQTLGNSGVNGQPSLNTIADALSTVGDYDIMIVPGSLKAKNYAFKMGKGLLHVRKAVLNIQADTKTKIFGDANPALTYTVTGFKNGETIDNSGLNGQPDLFTSATETSNVGTYTINVSKGNLNCKNYLFVFNNGTLTVTKAKLTVIAQDKSRIYGESNPDFTATYNGFKRGETLATSGIQGQPALNSTATVSSPAGNYEITIAQGSLKSDNYDFDYQLGNLSITKALLTIKANPQTKKYGAANPALTLTYSGFKNGEILDFSDIKGAVSVSTSAGSSSPVGSYPIEVQQGSLISNNYSFEFINDNLTIQKALIEVKADNKTRLFGSPNPALTYTFSGFVNSESLEISGVDGMPALYTSADQDSPAGGYDILVSQGSLTSKNYEFSFTKGMLVIGKGLITVTAENKRKTYGDPNPTLTYTYNGFVNGETLATSGITGTPVISSEVNQQTGAGDYDIVVSQGTLNAGNYVIQFIKGKFTVDKALVTVSAQDKSRLYGQPNPQFTATFNGFVNNETLASSGILGTPELGTPANATSPAGEYLIKAGNGTLLSNNYNFAFVDAKLTIGKAALKLTVDNKTKTYGDPNPEFTVTYNGFANGEVFSSGSVIGSLNFITDANTNSAAGQYEIRLDPASLFSDKYELSFASGQLTIAKAMLSIKAENKSRIYGVSNPPLTFTYNGFVNGENLSSSGVTGLPLLSTTANQLSGAGTYDIAITKGNLAATNYDFQVAKGTLTIDRATLTVSASAQTRKYGMANSTITWSLNYNGFANGENLQSSDVKGAPAFTTDATTSTSVGTYPVVLSKGTLTSGNYQFNFVNTELIIEKALVTISADNKSKLYGTSNPEFTYSYSGFMNGEILASSDVKGKPGYVTLATDNSPAGNYEIEPTLGNLNSGNYEFAFTKGWLTIGKATLTITVENKTRKYGTANPGFTVTYNGFVSGENLLSSGILGAPALNTAATILSPVGSYDIKASAGTLASDNYLFNFVHGKLTISKAQLAVTAENKVRPYGTANPVLTVTYNGFMNNEDFAGSGITGLPDISTTAGVTSPAGTYDITVGAGSLASSNYELVYTKGTLTVGKVVLTVNVENKSRTYGAQNPVFTVNYNGFANGETLSTSGISGKPALSTMATPSSPVGSYDISGAVGTLSAANYSFQFNKGTLSIGKALLVVTADDKAKSYGAEMPVLTASFSGFVNGETLSNSGVAGLPVLTTTATATSELGTYPIGIASGNLSADNYLFSFVGGKLVIGKAIINVMAENKTREYGEPNPTLTYTLNGFTNGETLATSGVSGLPVLSTYADAKTPAGDHDIVVSMGSLSSSKYEFNLVKAKLSITKATVIVTAENKMRYYGEKDPEFTANYIGFKNGEILSSSDITGKPSLTTAAVVTSPVGNYDIQATTGNLSSTNYKFIFNKGTLVVGKATLVVSANNLTRPFGAANPELTVTFNGLANGETYATSGMTGWPVLATTATATSELGTYDISIEPGNLTSGNYAFAFQKGVLTINKAILTVKAENKSKPYSSPNPELTFTYNGFVLGETLATSGVTGMPTISTEAETLSSAGDYDIVVGLGTLAAQHYQIDLVKGTLSITKIPLTITAESKSKVYGTANPKFTATYSGFVNGESLLTSGINGFPSYTTVANTNTGAGTYDIVIGKGSLISANYAFNFVNGSLTINKAQLTVTANNKSKIYGSSNPVLTSTITGFVLGETLATSGITGTAALTTPATAASPVGNYDIQPSLGTLVSANYAFNYVKGTLMVGKATLTISADNKTKVYSTGNPLLTASFDGFVNGESLVNSGVKGDPNLFTTADDNSPVGTYDIVATIGTLTSDNYLFIFNKGTLTIAKGLLTVAAENKSRIYGDPNPEFSYVISGFVTGETLETSGVTGVPGFSTLANYSSSVGNYDITPTAGTLSSANYVFNFVKATLTIRKAPLTVTADNKNKIYGAANPQFTASYAGFKNGESLAYSGVSGSPALTTLATSTSGVGNYDISAALGTLSSVNYEFSFVKGTLAIGKATITVTADNKSRVYGGANPVFSSSYTGFLNGENMLNSGITGAPQLTTVATQTSPVGNYEIVPSTGTLLSNNYTFNFVKGNLAIGKAMVTVIADNKSRIYGDANPDFSVSYEGFQNEETLENSGITGEPQLSTLATVKSAVGTYTITTAAGSLASGNYNFKIVNGVLTVQKALIHVTAENKFKKYGSLNPDLTVTYTGFKNGETLATSGIQGVPGISTTALWSSPLGAYPITANAGSLTSGNYDFNYVNGILTIGKATLTVTADNKYRTYGAANPNFTVTYNGFVNGETLATSGLTGAPGFVTPADERSSVGTYPITPADGTLAANNYEFRYVNGTLTIGKATLLVTADSKQKTYGSANPELTATFNGFMNNETLASSGVAGTPNLTTPASVSSQVGSYDIKAAIGSLTSGNYLFTFANGVLSIGKATVVVKADNQTRAYGAANPVLTVTYNGFMLGQNLASSGTIGAPVLSTSANEYSKVGDYEITITTGTLAALNYAFTVEKGTLAVGKATLNVTAENKYKIYGSPNPLFTATLNGFVNGESLITSGVQGEPGFTTEVDQFTQVGDYAIRPTGGNLSADNYAFNYVNGTLSVRKATLRVIADNRSRVYGAANPMFTASYEGFVNGESFANSGITGTPGLTTSAVATTPVGRYAILAANGTLSSRNYQFEFLNGLLTIGKATVTVKADNKSKAYGSANPQLTVTYNGFANGETFATSGVAGAPSLSTTATVLSEVGAYPIEPQINTLFSGNYDFAFAKGELTVTKAMIIVKAEDKTKLYGAANPVFSATYSGFVNNEDFKSAKVTGEPAFTTRASEISWLGNYPIVADRGTLSSPNYDFSFVAGNLSVVSPSCGTTGTLVVADKCYGSEVSLTYNNEASPGPYTLIINDSAYKNVYSGVPFNTGIVARNLPESLWSNDVVGEDPASPSSSAIEIGIRIRPNVEGSITGIRFYKRSANTGTHVGSLWSTDGTLLARATFTNETATGWQQVTFSEPVEIIPGATYIASYFAPNGNFAVTPNAFRDFRVTNKVGSLTALRAADGGNGMFRLGGGFPKNYSSDNANYYVDVMFANANKTTRMALSGVISATGCAAVGEPIQAIEMNVVPSIGVGMAKQDPECVEGRTGSISLTAYGCNGPFTFSVDSGATYQANGNFANLGVGTYKIRVKDAGSFTKDTVMVLGVERAMWTGAISTDWHNAGNWSTLKVPTASTHVIIPNIGKDCFISGADATVASIQVMDGAILRATNSRKLYVTGKCAVLPNE